MLDALRCARKLRNVFLGGKKRRRENAERMYKLFSLNHLLRLYVLH